VANFAGQGPIAAPGAVDAVDTTKAFPLGTRLKDSEGNEFIYVQGVASGAAGSWVSFDEAFVTTLLTANAKGRVGILLAALDATTDFGWAQIYGKNTIAKVAASFADNGLIYATATPGTVDDAVVAGDLVVGAIGRSAISGGVATVELSYPFITDALG
jgi:hypothetical protein